MLGISLLFKDPTLITDLLESPFNFFTEKNLRNILIKITNSPINNLDKDTKINKIKAKVENKIDKIKKFR